MATELMTIAAIGDYFVWYQIPLLILLIVIIALWLWYRKKQM